MNVEDEGVSRMNDDPTQPPATAVIPEDYDPEASKPVALLCPECGNDALGEINTVVAEGSWVIQDGVIAFEPIGYTDLGTQGDHDDLLGDSVVACRDCGWRGTVPIV